MNDTGKKRPDRIGVRGDGAKETSLFDCASSSALRHHLNHSEG